MVGVDTRVRGYDGWGGAVLFGGDWGALGSDDRTPGFAGMTEVGQA